MVMIGPEPVRQTVKVKKLTIFECGSDGQFMRFELECENGEKYESGTFKEV
jgi:hypothetical protein